MSSEERVMRAREVLAAEYEATAPAGKYVARDIRNGILSAENERAIRAMLAFADEGPGIGELRVLLPPGSADAEYVEIWCEAQQYLIDNLPASAPEQIAENANCSEDAGLVELLIDWRDYFAPDGKRIRLADGNKERLHMILDRVIWRLTPPDIDRSGLAQEVG